MRAGAHAFPTRYADVEKIATGGMGEIYAARDETLGRSVAIKLLAERFARDEAVRRRFTREALAAAKLSGHPHIVTIFDVGETQGRPFIVMEFLPGGTVADRARRGRVRREQALAWLAQAADALDEAHRNGIVHRDVKPANLLLDERDDLHVGDFGIARIVDETTTGMTIAGTVLGTAGYLAPEQARGEPATPASDVYALGIVAYELLTGGRPFEGGSATSEAAAHIHQPVPRASERGTGLPRDVDAVFERALAKDPAVRHGTAHEFVRALREALGPTPVPRALPAPAAPVPPTRQDERARTRKRREPKPRPWIPVVVALALAAAAIAGVVLAATLGGDDEPAVTEAQEEQPGEPEVVTVTETLPGTTVVETATVEAPPPSPAPPSPSPSPPPPAAGGGSGQDGGRPSMAEARDLTDQATAAMGGGDYERAYALAERALTRLRGTGDIYEAYALYNAGNSLAELGECGQALAYLDGSEEIQGERREIDEARAKCA